MSTQLRSPLNWMGGKARIASRIMAAFPPAASYKVFCEVFCGSASILFAKPPANHLEVINDRNERLITFWMAVREEAERLQWKLETLPYSTSVFKRYRESLTNRESMEAIEEAARWFYVNRSTIGGHIDSSKGWSFTGPQSRIKYGVPSDAVGYQNAVSLLPLLSERLSRVQIHNEEFDKIIQTFETPETLLYVDPPYLGDEHYYGVDDTPPFTPEKHKLLADLLNATPAKVVLSYYAHPLLDEMYSDPKWRRITWTTLKESSRMNKTLQQAQEVLLMNYEPATSKQADLWSQEEVA